MLHFAFAVAAALTLPKYWTVHIDTPRPDVRKEFEKTDVEFYGIQRDVYAEHHIDRPPVLHFSAGGAYYGLRPRASLSEIEKPSGVPDDVRKLIADKTAPVSERTHALLTTHHNEIWQTDTDLATISSPAAPRHMKLRVDSVNPGAMKPYDEVMKQVKAACEKNGIGILAFFSVYGTGDNLYLFTSDKPINLRTLVGRDVMSKWRACLNTSREEDAQPRPDLTATEPAHWLP